MITNVVYTRENDEFGSGEANIRRINKLLQEIIVTYTKTTVKYINQCHVS